jgi:hypothetical protein
MNIIDDDNTKYSVININNIKYIRDGSFNIASLENNIIYLYPNDKANNIILSLINIIKFKYDNYYNKNLIHYFELYEIYFELNNLKNGMITNLNNISNLYNLLLNNDVEQDYIDLIKCVIKIINMFNLKKIEI